MSDSNEHLESAYIEKKRRELTELRDALRRASAAAEIEEGDVKDASAGQSREFEDDAQKLDTLEKEGVLVNRSVERIARIERALAKIDAGTYGFSDVSGKPIPKERLDALPDAINTIREQEDSERSG
jgi:DnaK suppressor protein